MIEEIAPEGEPNNVHLTRKQGRVIRCAFCDKPMDIWNEQGVPSCNEHKDLRLILKCPICNLDLAIHSVANGTTRYWCVKHEGFFANELKKNSKYDENEDIKKYWKKEAVKKRREEAEKMNRDFYGNKGLTEQTKEEKEDYLKKKST